MCQAKSVVRDALRCSGVAVVERRDPSGGFSTRAVELALEHHLVIEHVADSRSRRAYAQHRVTLRMTAVEKVPERVLDDRCAAWNRSVSPSRSTIQR